MSAPRPAHRRGRIDRGFEIVAERGAERGLVALLDREIVDHRRPQVLGVDVEQLRQRLGFGIEPLRAALGLGERPARRRRAPGGRRNGRPRRAARRLPPPRPRPATARPRRPARPGRRDRASASSCASSASTAAISSVRRVSRSPCSRAAFSSACRRAVRSASVPVSASEVFSAAASAASASATRWSTPARCSSLAVVSRSQRLLLGARAGRARPPRRLARRRSRSMSSPSWTSLRSSSAMRSLARVSSRSSVSRAITSRCRAAAALASPSRKAGSSAAASAWRVEASACSPVRSATRRTAESLARSASAELGIGGDPAQMEQRGLGLAHLLGDRAIADRLPRLPLERVDLAGELADHVLEPRQVLLGRAQPQLRLVPARVQAGDAGRLLEHAPALLRLGLDDLADAPLVHQRGRARAGRGVGKQDVHVARAHLAAVDAIGRALLALDPARDVEGLVLVELRRRLARAVVDLDRRPRRCCAPAGCWCRRRSRRPCRRRAATCARSRPSPSAAPRPGSTCRSRSARPRRSVPARS